MIFFSGCTPTNCECLNASAAVAPFTGKDTGTAKRRTPAPGADLPMKPSGCDVTQQHGKYKPRPKTKTLEQPETPPPKKLTTEDIMATMTEEEKQGFEPGLLSGQLEYIKTLLG